jgi:hypothetical protein
MQETGKKPFFSPGKEIYEALREPYRSRAGEDDYIMRCRNLALFLLFSSLMVGQSIDTRKVATVHVYRQGRLLVAVSVLADGNKVVALTPHKSATFYLVPGYHALTMQSGEISPTASFRAVAGKEYFFQLDYEHVVSATSLRDLSVTLTMQPKITGADELREVTIDQTTLLEILSQSNPNGLEPRDPILTDANANSGEQAAVHLVTGEAIRR